MKMNTDRVTNLAMIYQKSLKETVAAMSRYAAQYPCAWDDINWEGIDLAPYFLNADNVREPN